MPGAYAHITLVNVLKEPRHLDAIAGFPDVAKAAALKYFKYCELGAVSPDYPYLAVGDKGAASWADAMHYTRTGEMIHAGVRRLRDLQGAAQQKCLAWLLGYAAHVATDVTIHPVVELKVGPYEQNKTHHRVCEMNQDAYIFRRLNLGGIGLAEHLDAGIGACGSDGAKALDTDIRALWDGMLRDVHAQAYAANPPNLDKWHRGFKLVVDNFAEEGEKLLPFARHVAVGQGLTYPTREEVDMAEYIEDLAIPNGRLHYDQIFDRAVGNVGLVWGWVAAGALQGDEAYAARIGNWNLDTGRDPSGRHVFWS